MQSRLVRCASIWIAFSFFLCTPAEGVVLIKADDYAINSAWEKFIHEAIKQDIGVNIGLIITTLQVNEVRASVAKHLESGVSLSFFVHGITHQCSGRESEFTRSDFGEQKEMLAYARSEMISLGASEKMAFGAPCNATNDYTQTALNETGYVYWLLPYSKKDEYLGETFDARYDVEVSPGNIDYSKLEEIAFGVRQLGEVVVIQVHPGGWNGYELSRFFEAMVGLKRGGVEFLVL